jgi:acyl-[acyl-carrier-protein]-phospholipid O-acyltransferase/long-chain-fatty-acid--[acyl-carrier-protein] ligase
MIKRLLAWILRRLFKIKTVGTFEYKGGHTIIIANHQSFLDGLILGAILPIDPVFVVNIEIAKQPFARLILALSEYLVVDPSNPMAVKTIIRLVESGRPVMIFPEGRITTTGGLMKIYEGSAFVAMKTHATILPIVIEGATLSTLSRMPQHHPRQWFPPITITYGTPTRIHPPQEGSIHDQRAHAGEAMRRVMQLSIFESRPSLTLWQAYLGAMKTYGRSRPIIEDISQKEYTYGDVLKMALGLGRLVSRHTVLGENVGVLMPTAVASFGLIMGLSATGRTPAMLNFTVGSQGLQSACDAAQITTIITSKNFVEQGKLTDKIAVLVGINILYLEELKQEFTFGDKLWLMGYALWSPHAIAPSSYPEEKAVILFTSGSEGTPKGVVLSHNALLANVMQIRSIVDFSTDDKMLNALPIFHSFGLTAGTLLPVFTGMHLFMYPSPLHYRVIPEIAYDRSCTILLGTGTFLAQYGKHAHPYDFYRLRYVIAGAEKLSSSVRDLWFEKFGIRIFEGYGATETAPVIAVNTPMGFKSGTVGQMLPGIEHKLIPVAGIEEGGVLHVKGPNVMSGYLRATAPGILEHAFSDSGEGWYDTGDVVTIDSQGFVTLVGRVKRFAKIAGEMISLESVEKLAQWVNPLAHHAASSSPDESRGERIILFTTDKTLSRDGLQQIAKKMGYPEISIPKKIVFLESIPILGTGKTDYATLKMMASEIG